MIVLTTSRSFEHHIRRSLEGHPISLVRSMKGLPSPDADEPGLCLYHLSAFPETLDARLAEHIEKRQLILGVASDEPGVEEFLQLSQFGLKAYVNSYMADLHYRQMLQVVGAGQSWVVPPILDEALLVAREGTRPVRELALLDPLTAREREVALDVAKGFSNPEVAARLGISEPTVKVHLGRVFKKLGISNRYTLALKLQGHREAS